MRPFLAALALFLAATLLAAVCCQQQTRPATVHSANASWKMICAGGFELLATSDDATRAYLVDRAISASSEKPRVLLLDLPRFLAAGQPPVAVPVQTLDIRVATDPAAFGVSQDTVPLRVALTPDGPITFLHPDGQNRQLCRSRDGKRIVFNDRGHNGLWLTDPAGSMLLRLCPHASDNAAQVLEAARRAKAREGWSFHWATEPAWSPDDRFILYCSTRSAPAEAAAGIWLLDPSSGQELLLADGKKFGFLKPVGWCSPTTVVLQAGDLSVKLLDFPTGRVEPLFDGAIALACSPTGLVAFRKVYPGRALATPGVWLVRPGTGEIAFLGAPPEPHVMNAGGSWSPAGERFAFFAYHPEDPADTVLVVAEASKPGYVSVLPPPSPQAAFAKSAAPQWVGRDTVICRLLSRASGGGEESTWLLRLSGQ